MTKQYDSVRQSARSTGEFNAPLAAGTYLVGDPCYAFSNALDHNWQDWLADAWKDVDANSVKILDGRVNGMRIAASTTAYGDGSYRDQDGFEYLVDAGLLGAVHIGFIRNLYPEYAGLPHEKVAEECSMRLVEFDRPLHVSYDDDSGLVSVGHIHIATGDSPYDEEDLCDNCGGDDGEWCTCLDDDDNEEN